VGQSTGERVYKKETRKKFKKVFAGFLKGGSSVVESLRGSEIQEPTGYGQMRKDT